ncbi:adhesion G protein-coupled receptor E3-like isoform X1 [Bufo gargarizans]|uniref:adhesion G protein-coupled receptor E3-like isoform X1 n=1 Tax=Bufo gargarizans TaxID=30331 RepID=UPI001CF31DEF|nr:adhesion G protein-coupled receptor E3-like isoform X1 [Bufo gargarizans]
MDQRFSTHLLLVILGLTSVTIAQQDQLQCVKEDNPLKDEKACPNDWICPSNETCDNSTMCRCRKGYRQRYIEGAVLCFDINECAENYRCGNGAKCKNTIGSFYCECDTNLQENDTQFCPNQTNENYCKDVKKELSLTCLVGTLPPNTTNCNNRICPAGQVYNASFPCVPGYEEDLGACVDIHECVVGNHVCGYNALCKNTRGGYHCTCSAGYQNGNQTAFCPSKDRTQNECTDIDECSEVPGICGSNSICNNILGSYVCFCNKGFTYISDTCKDIDECADVPGICGSNSICNNILGSYVCFCNKGFANISDTCKDIDECADVPGICGSNSICNNILGSYVCFCNKGFTNISDTCKDIDECADVPGICGSNLICNNTLGSYHCICGIGFSYISDTCDDAQFQNPNTSEPQSSSRGQHQNTVCSVLRATIANLNVSCHSNVKLTTKEAENQLENGTKILSDILEEYHTLSTPDSPNTGKTTTTILKNVETFVLKSFIDAPRNQTIITPQLAISMKVSSDHCTSVGLFFRLMLNDNLMEVPCDQLDRDTDGGVFIVYKGLDSSLNGNILESSQISEDDDDMAIVNSRVVTGAITRTLTSQVTFKLAHIRSLKNFHNPVCVFWDPIKNGWSRDGCITKSSESNDTHTTCSCNHLSSFAVIMAPLGLEDIQDNHALTILSYFGLIVSVLCLALTLLTFVFCRTLRSAHTSVLTALCSCLFLGQVLFLVGINQTCNKILCSVIAGGLHFLFLSAFCWMSIESVMLFMTVRNLRAVNYMTSHRSNFPMMSLLGFGIPALIVGISAAIEADGYGTNQYCWLRPNSTIWSFLGPVALVIVMNTALLVFTFILLRRRLATINTNVSTLKNSRSLTFKALAQFFILGCTWGIGFFRFINVSLVIAYIFTICNSLQGVYIFLVHCVFNYQVRQEYKKLSCKARKRGKLSMDDSTPNNVTKSITLTEISKPACSEKTTAETKITWTQD